MPDRGKRENVGFFYCIFRTACFVVARIHRVGRQLEYDLWSPETMNLVVRKLLPGNFSDFQRRGGEQKLQNPVNLSMRRAWPRT